MFIIEIILKYLSTFFPAILFSVLSQVKISILRKQHNRYVKAYGIGNLTLDFCKYFRGGMTSNFMDLISKEMKTSSNIFRPCPITVTVFQFFHNRKDVIKEIF